MLTDNNMTVYFEFYLFNGIYLLRLCAGRIKIIINNKTMIFMITCRRIVGTVSASRSWNIHHIVAYSWLVVVLTFGLWLVDSTYMRKITATSLWLAVLFLVAWRWLDEFLLVVGRSYCWWACLIVGALLRWSSTKSQSINICFHEELFISLWWEKLGR